MEKPDLSGTGDDSTPCGIYEMEGCVIVPVPAYIHRKTVENLRTRVLARIDKRAIKGIIMDMSAVNVLEGLLFSLLYETVKMIELMGFPTVFVGFQPGVAVALVDLNVDTHDICAASELPEGIDMLEELSAGAGDD